MADFDLGELAKVSRLFEALDNSGRKRLLEISHKAHKKAGEVIFREGDAGGEFFVISNGEVRVSAVVDRARGAEALTCLKEAFNVP